MTGKALAGFAAGFRIRGAGIFRRPRIGFGEPLGFGPPLSTGACHGK